MTQKLTKVFKSIYNENKWHNEESKSGAGSTVEYTKNIRDCIPGIIEQFKIKSILDAPCGDFNWMKLLLPTVDVKYTGGDIVPGLIEENKKYETKKIKFIVLDITQDVLPKADLMICRDCLFHLPNFYITSFFRNFLDSNISYLLTTTHVNDKSFENTDIKIGGFRKIDLFSEPFSLDKNVIYRIDDYIDGFPPREMVLFSRDQILKRYGMNND